MGEKSNNSYIVAPIVGIVLTVFEYFNLYGRYNISNLLEKYDITGMTNGYMISILVLNLAVLAFCLYKGKEAREKNYDYSFNMIFVVIFIVLSLYSLIAFIVVRGEEESVAAESMGNFDYYNIDLTTQSSSNKKRNSSDIDEYNVKMMEELTKLQEDKCYSRKLEINQQVKDSTKFERYANLFLNWFIFDDIFYYLTEEENYYSVFAAYCSLDLFMCAFYIIHLNDGNKFNVMNIME